MKKLEMAMDIAHALFMKPVKEDNWKVKDLMRRNKTDLEEMHERAIKFLAKGVMNLADRNRKKLKKLVWTKKFENPKSPYLRKITVWDYCDAIHGGNHMNHPNFEPVKYEVEAWCLQGETGFRAYFYHDDMLMEAYGDDGFWRLIGGMHKHWLKEFKEVVNAIEEKE